MLQANRKTSIKTVLCVIAALGVVGSSAVFAQAQRLGDGVILLNMVFNNGEWKGNVDAILPCFGPSKISRDVGSSALVRSLDGDRKVYYERRFLSPRVIQVERGTENPGLLSELDFVLKVPFHEGAQYVEFWDLDAEQKPSVRVNVREQAKAYMAAGGLKQDAPCQFLPKEPVTSVKQDKPVPKVKNYDDSFAALRRMLDSDPDMILTLAKNADISLSDVRNYLNGLDDDALIRAGFTRQEVDAYLKKMESLQSR